MQVLDPKEWYVTGRLGMTVSYVAQEILSVKFGKPWPDSVSLGFDCRPYQGASYSLPDEDYWVYQCSGAWLYNTGTRTDYIYLLKEAPLPTLERVQFSFPGIPDGDSNYWDRMRAALVDTLERRTGRLRSIQGDTLVLRTGITILPGEGHALDCYSSDLVSDLASSTWSGEAWEAQEDTIPSARVEVTRALAKVNPPLAAFVESPRTRGEDVALVARALERVKSRSTEGQLTAYAAHLWASTFAARLPSGDTTLVHAFNTAFSSRGAAIVMTHDGDWCYTGNLIEPLLETPDADRWTRHAFVERMEDGWMEPCALCGWVSAWHADYFRPTIERGEAFLRAHPDSPIALEVGLVVGKAHETAWSLSKARGGSEEEYIAVPNYALQGPAHRIQAMERYEAQLRKRPGDLRNERIARRLARLRIDVDTGYHRYWCIWD